MNGLSELANHNVLGRLKCTRYQVLGWGPLLSVWVKKLEIRIRTSPIENLRNVSFFVSWMPFHQRIHSSSSSSSVYVRVDDSYTRVSSSATSQQEFTFFLLLLLRGLVVRTGGGYEI